MPDRLEELEARVEALTRAHRRLESRLQRRERGEETVAPEPGDEPGERLLPPVEMPSGLLALTFVFAITGLRRAETAG